MQEGVAGDHIRRYPIPLHEVYGSQGRFKIALFAEGADEDVVGDEIRDDGGVGGRDIAESGDQALDIAGVSECGEEGIEGHVGARGSEGGKLAKGSGGVGGHGGLAVEGNEADGEALAGEVGGEPLLGLEDGLDSVKATGLFEAADGDLIDAVAAAEAMGGGSGDEAGGELVGVALPGEFADGNGERLGVRTGVRVRARCHDRSSGGGGEAADQKANSKA